MRGINNEMGTSYYELKKPITDITINKNKEISLTIWINSCIAGVLLVREEELKDVIGLFKSDRLIYHSYFGGEEKGVVFTKHNSTEDPVVISEYNEIVSVAELEKHITKVS